jgi:hypothetical protein
VVKRRPRPNRVAGSYRRAIQEEVTEALVKALSLPRGATTQQITEGYLASLQRNGSPRIDGVYSLPRDPNNLYPFGPGEAPYPAPIAPVLPSTGRQPPQLRDFATAWNTQIGTSREIPFTILRDASHQVSIVRACIDVCISSITGLDWSFGIDSSKARALAKKSNTSSHEVISDLQDKFADDIERLHSWWQKPDRINNLTFVQWLTMLMEDEIVLDAVSLYPHFALGGDLHSMEIVDSACYSADTEVLTRRGWLPFSRVDTATDEFATRNQKTKAFEWQQANYYHRVPFTGDLCHFHSRSLDLLVTPNHRMVIEGLPRVLGGSRHRQGESIVTAGELSALGRGDQGRRIPMTSYWEASDLERFELAANGRTTSKSFECSGDDFAAFMGMYLSEGCASNGDQLFITQAPKSKGFEPFQELLERIFGRRVCHTGTNFVVGRKVLHDYLKPFGKAHEKYVPDVVKNMSSRQLGIFWRFYMLGDGSYGPTETISTSSLRMADDLQEVAQKMGFSASVRYDDSDSDTIMTDGRVIKAENKRRKYTVALSRTEYRSWSADPVAYDGEVFCVSVPNEVLYVRRHGKAAWCGNTIKPLLDDRGATPQPPYPAYQQIRYGFPRGEYTQSQDPDQEFTSVIYGKPASSADTDQLMYKVRNCRSSSPYGFSNVERALIDIDLWLKRYDWLRSEYSAGVTPEMVVKVDMAMTPEQLRQYESIFNDDLSGRTAERHRARFLPSGFDPSYPGNLDAKFASDLDLHIVRLICASFDVLPTSLGFTPNHNPGMAGNSNQKGEQDSQLARGTKPRVKFLVGLINEISHNYLGMPNEVTFAFHGIDDEDEQKEAALLEGYIASGLMVINEGRDRLNLPRFGIDQANEPFISTPTGPSFLNPKVQPSGMPGNLPSAGQNAPGGRPTDPNPGGKENGYQPSVEVRAANEPRDESVQGKKAEQKAFMSCVQASLKQGKEWRDFTFKVYDPITGEAANRLAAAGDVDACKALFTLRDEP